MQAMAGMSPTVVAPVILPVKTVSRMPAWRKLSPGLSSPLAASIAMREAVPVPHGERSMTVGGQTTAFFPSVVSSLPSSMISIW